MHQIASLFISLALLSGNAYTQNLIITIGNQTRSSLIYAPAGAVNPPLVISMHGLSGTGQQQRNMSRFEPIAEREKFVVAFPDGLSNRWDISGATDVNFILAIIDSAAQRYGIDRNRVYATGFSMGGMMSYHLANRVAEKIAAIGPVAGFLLGNDPHNSSRPMPILHIHGETDSVVTYNRLANILTAWATHNECPETPQTVKPYPETKATSKVTKQIWSPCDKSEIISLTVAGMGHGYSTGPDINSSEEVWSFLKRYSLAGVSGIRREETQTLQPQLHSAWCTSGKMNLHGERLRGVQGVDVRGKRLFEWEAEAGTVTSLSIPLRVFRQGSITYISGVPSETKL
jgi:poly(3-hydroxybutyrate) depolymerase